MSVHEKENSSFFYLEKLRAYALRFRGGSLGRTFVLVFVLLLVWTFMTNLMTKTQKATLPYICSHQGRQNLNHRPVYLDDILPSLKDLLRRGITCFDLDLSPMPGVPGGTAIAHPAALTAAAAISNLPLAPTLDYPQLFALFSEHPKARLTLEVKAPLNADPALLAQLAESISRAGLLQRVVVLGIHPVSLIPRELHYATDIRDIPTDGVACNLGRLSPHVSIVMPSMKCWLDERVRGKLVEWALSKSTQQKDGSLLPLASGEIHVWSSETAREAEEAVGFVKGSEVVVKVITNSPSSMYF